MTVMFSGKIQAPIENLEMKSNLVKVAALSLCLLLSCLIFLLGSPPAFAKDRISATAVGCTVYMFDDGKVTSACRNLDVEMYELDGLMILEFRWEHLEKPWQFIVQVVEGDDELTLKKFNTLRLFFDVCSLSEPCDLMNEENTKKLDLKDFEGTLENVKLYQFTGSDDLSLLLSRLAGTGLVGISDSTLNIIYRGVIGESLPMATFITSKNYP